MGGDNNFVYNEGNGENPISESLVDLVQVHLNRVLEVGTFRLNIDGVVHDLLQHFLVIEAVTLSIELTERQKEIVEFLFQGPQSEVLMQTMLRDFKFTTVELLSSQLIEIFTYQLRSDQYLPFLQGNSSNDVSIENYRVKLLSKFSQSEIELVLNSVESNLDNVVKNAITLLFQYNQIIFDAILNIEISEQDIKEHQKNSINNITTDTKNELISTISESVKSKLDQLKVGVSLAIEQNPVLFSCIAPDIPSLFERSLLEMCEIEFNLDLSGVQFENDIAKRLLTKLAQESVKNIFLDILWHTITSIQISRPIFLMDRDN